MSGFWSKKMEDFTVADTLKFTGLVTVLSIPLCLAPVGVCWLCEKIDERKARKEDEE